MPRTKLQAMVEEGKRRPVWERTFVAALDYAIAMKGMTRAEACDLLGLSRSTFYSYLRRPDTMPLGVFNSMVKKLGIPAESVSKITGARPEQ